MLDSDQMVYLNGEILPLKEAKVSVLDRGFLFGDGVYEVIPIYHGKLFLLREHLERLDRSLNGIHLNFDLHSVDWIGCVDQIKGLEAKQYLYLQITRGVGCGRSHTFPKEMSSTIFMMCAPIPESQNKQGVKCLLVSDSRWLNCHLKTTSLLGHVLHKQEAYEKENFETILYRDQWITEGSASNVFAVIEGKLKTPPLSNEILPGITRHHVIQLAEKSGIGCEETPISIQDIQRAEEIWLTSSTQEILPVIQLENQVISKGQPGPIWRRLNEIFQNEVEKYK